MWTDSAFEHLLSDPYAPHPVANRHILNGGGKGQQQQGQGPTSTTSNVTQTNLPEYAKPYFESILNRSQAVSNDPYQAYGGQRIADFNPTQYEAMGMATNNINNWNRNVGQADQSMGQATFNPQQATNTYQADNQDPNQWTDQGVAQSYMNPYQQNVTDIAKREATRDYNIQSNTRDSQANAAGAFGGYRQGIVEAEANRNLNQHLGDIEQTGLNNSYQAGLGAYNADRSALMSANQMNNQYGQAQSSLGLQANNQNNQYAAQAGQLNLARGQAQAGLGQLTQQLSTNDMNNVMQVGNMQQAHTQQGLDMAYQDFVNQRDYPRQDLNWMSGILNRTPVSANSSVYSTNTQPAPNSMSQIAGLGLGAAGLYKMMS